MSLPVSPSSNSSKTELEIVVNWRIVALGAALAALLVIVPTVGFLCFTGYKTEPAAQSFAAERPRASAVAPRSESPRFRFDPATLADLAPPSSLPVAVPEAIPSPSIEPVRFEKRPNITAHIHRPEPAPKETAKSPAFRTLGPSYAIEYELRRQLREYVQEFKLAESDRTALIEAAKPKASAAKDAKKDALTILDIPAKRSGLRGLPLRQAKDCTKKVEDAKKAQAVSRYFRRNDRRAASPSDPNGSPSADMLADRALVELLENNCAKYGVDEVAILVQMFQVNGSPVRMQLVKLLDGCKDERASVLLAERALFDLSEEVRQAAIAALKKRLRADYRRTLLNGFGHPWPQVAKHAAEALAALQDLDAAPKLAALLDNPDPAGPICNDEGKWVVKEMVRINHLRNCVLCHAPSSDEKDPMRSPIPSPSEKLPVVYYERIRGPAVRADITYLRQDFSLLEPVANAAPWPVFQRFDYIVRKRELTDAEIKERVSRVFDERAFNYPHRDAVLFALRELTGEDAGTSSAAWRLLLWRIGLTDSL
jgi:hypothetical protein